MPRPGTAKTTAHRLESCYLCCHRLLDRHQTACHHQTESIAKVPSLWRGVMIVCPGCQSFVGLAASGFPPPWCPKCGTDLKGAAVAPPPPQRQKAPPQVHPVDEPAAM